MKMTVALRTNNQTTVGDPVGCSKRPSGEAAADDRTGGVASWLR